MHFSRLDLGQRGRKGTPLLGPSLLWAVRESHYTSLFPCPARRWSGIFKGILGFFGNCQLHRWLCFSCVVYLKTADRSKADALSYLTPQFLRGPWDNSRLGGVIPAGGASRVQRAGKGGKRPRAPFRRARWPNMQPLLIVGGSHTKRPLSCPVPECSWVILKSRERGPDPEQRCGEEHMLLVIISTQNPENMGGYQTFSGLISDFP